MDRSSEAIEGRVPPYDAQAERAVLGALLIDNELMTLRGDLQPDHFYLEAHRRLYSTMLDLFDARVPMDAVTVGNQLIKRGDLQAVGGPTVFDALTDAVPPRVHFENYVRIVVEKAAVRRTIYAAQQIVAEGFGDSEDTGAYLANSQQILSEAATMGGEGSAARPAATLARETVAWLEQAGPPEGLVPSGFGAYDRAFGGWWPGLLHVVGARPGMGKTALLVNAVTNAALAGHSVLFFSLEDTARFVTMRQIARLADVDLQRLTLRNLGRDEWRGITDAATALSALPFAVDESAGLTTRDIRLRALRHRARHGLHAIFLDHLGFLKDKGKDLFERTTYVVQGLAEIAKELNVPLIAACQLSRAVEQRTDHRPNLADLRQSGEIEQAARVVLFPVRPGYYSEDAGAEDHRMILHVAKCNHGRTGDVRLWCDMSRMTVRAWETEDGEYTAGGGQPAPASATERSFTERERRQEAAEKDY